MFNRSLTKISAYFLPIFICSCASEQLRDNTVDTGSTTTDLIYEMALSNIAMVRYYNGEDSNAFNNWSASTGGAKNKKKSNLAKLNPGLLYGKEAVELNSSGETVARTSTIATPSTPQAPSIPATVITTTETTVTTPAAAPPVGSPLTMTDGDIIPWAYDITGGSIAVNDSIGLTPELTADMSSMHIFHPSLSIPMSRGIQQSWAVTPVTDTKALNIIKGYYYAASVAKSIDTRKTGYLFRSGDAPEGCLRGIYRDKVVWVPKDDPEAMANLTYLTQKVMAAIEDADSRAGARKAGNTPSGAPVPLPFF